MRAKVVEDEKGVKVTFADEKQEKQKERQAKLDAIADRKAKGKLTLEDVDAKLDVVVEILEQMLDK